MDWLKLNIWIHAVTPAAEPAKPTVQLGAEPAKPAVCAENCQKTHPDGQCPGPKGGPPVVPASDAEKPAVCDENCQKNAPWCPMSWPWRVLLAIKNMAMHAVNGVIFTIDVWDGFSCLTNKSHTLVSLFIFFILICLKRFIFILQQLLPKVVHNN